MTSQCSIFKDCVWTATNCPFMSPLPGPTCHTFNIAIVVLNVLFDYVFNVLLGSAEHSKALVPGFGFDATGILGFLFLED